MIDIIHTAYAIGTWTVEKQFEIATLADFLFITALLSIYCRVLRIIHTGCVALRCVACRMVPRGTQRNAGMNEPSVLQ